MTTIADIEALGIELPKTNHYYIDTSYLTGGRHKVAADDAVHELLAVIERLAGFGGASFEAGFQERQRAEQAEADLDWLIDTLDFNLQEPGFAQKALDERRARAGGE